MYLHMVEPTKLYCNVMGILLLGMWRMQKKYKGKYKLLIVVILIQTFMYTFIVGHSKVMHWYHFIATDPIPILFRWKMADTNTDTDTLVCKHYSQKTVCNFNTILIASL